MAAERAGSMSVEQFTEKAVGVVEQCARVSFVTGGRILSRDAGAEVEARWTQKDLVRCKKITCTRYYTVECCAEGVRKISDTHFGGDASSVVKVAYASECDVRALLVKDRPTKPASPSDDPQQYIEVWVGGALAKTIDVQTLKKHGKINEDNHFGSFQLSPDGSRLLYVAEREKPKAVSYFAKSKPEGCDNKPTVKGAEFEYEQSWGEQLPEVVNPCPVVLDLGAEEGCHVITPPGDVSAGQAQWVPGEEGGVVFVGWENRPRKLGFVFCFNRNSALYYANTANAECKRLTEPSNCVYSPRFNPQGSRLIFCQSPAGGPHRTCAELMMMTWSDKTVSTVVGVVSRPDPAHPFPGMYTAALPERCWDSEGVRVVWSDAWEGSLEVESVRVDGGRVVRLSGDKKGAWSVIDVSHDLVLAQYASPNCTPKLLIGKLPTDSSHTITWTELDSPAPSSSLTDGVSWEKLSFTPEGENAIPYGAILIRPRPPEGGSPPPPPLAVYPHGGPHGSYTTDFIPRVVSLVALGFATLLVNYRGSSGQGQASVDSLLGRIGTQDVQDVQNAAVSLIESGRVDGERVVVLGGSHGGFLAAHLIGQFPDFYKSAVAFNAVIDISVNASLSDIPDWCYVECGLPYDPKAGKTVADSTTLLSMSPVLHADQIKTPLLLVVGGEDRRVPLPQSMQLYHTLKARGATTRLLLYPSDCHPINTVSSEADSLVNSAVWLYRYGCLQEKNTTLS